MSLIILKTLPNLRLFQQKNLFFILSTFSRIVLMYSQELQLPTNLLSKRGLQDIGKNSLDIISLQYKPPAIRLPLTRQTHDQRTRPRCCSLNQTLLLPCRHMRVLPSASCLVIHVPCLGACCCELF